MGDNEEKARKILADAEKKSKSGGGFLGGLFSGGKSDEACDAYVRAANLFKMAKNWTEAGNCFVKSAQVHINKGDAKHDAASNFVEASTCYRKVDLRKAVDCLMKAAEIYTDMGRFSMAAKHHMSIAEMYEDPQVRDLEKAMQHYEKAADYYQGEESKSSANKCLLKVAQYAAEIEQYPKAIEIYENVGISAADNQLLKYSAKDYFFRASLCQTCVDLLNGQQAVKKYEDLHPPFADSRECKLMKELLLACEENNADQFTEAVRQYDAISRLDQWYTTMLLRIKKTIADDNVDLK